MVTDSDSESLSSELSILFLSFDFLSLNLTLLSTVSTVTPSLAEEGDVRVTSLSVCLLAYLAYLELQRKSYIPQQLIMGKKV